MTFNKHYFIRTLHNAVILSFLILAFTGITQAGPLKPVPGEFTVTLQGFDTDTGELIFEGVKTGEISGHLSTRVSISRQTGVAMHLVTRWRLTTYLGEIVEGENTSVLNTVSLHFREHGLIQDATGSLAERIGNFVVIHGEVSDVIFIPGITTATAKVTYVPAQAN